MRVHQYVGDGPYCERCNAPNEKSRIHNIKDVPVGDRGLDDDGQLIDRVLMRMVQRGEPFSLNECRHQLASVRQKSRIGERVQAFAKEGLIVNTGDGTPSTDRGTHGHRIAIWRPKLPQYTGDSRGQRGDNA